MKDCQNCKNFYTCDNTGYYEECLAENQKGYEDKEKEKVFIIKVDYYIADPEEKVDYITRPRYLGTEPPMGIYVFDECITERTKKFSSKTEARKYINAHNNLKNSICYENIRIEEE